MKLFNIFVTAIIIATGTYSCKESSSTSPNATVDNSEPIEIEFLKEGELTLSNNDSILKQVDIEIAKSNNERAIGLMNRSSMEENQGMLFVFEQDNSTGFYMKDTRIPLDIIFIGADSTVITISENRQPFDTTSQGASAPYRYVLEVNGGKAKEWNVQEGVTKIDWTEM
ncbi:DUF192 domain-containing protein [Flavobacteriaceae bacterium Ap0902]|nr:DUF192 domain-containing protein [Flavobacteriaceae bacterium Ap0902]